MVHAHWSATLGMRLMWPCETVVFVSYCSLSGWWLGAFLRWWPPSPLRVGRLWPFITSLITWPLWGESTGCQWIPLIKDCNDFAAMDKTAAPWLYPGLLHVQPHLCSATLTGIYDHVAEQFTWFIMVFWWPNVCYLNPICTASCIMYHDMSPCL